MICLSPILRGATIQRVLFSKNFFRFDLNQEAIPQSMQLQTQGRRIRPCCGSTERSSRWRLAVWGRHFLWPVADTGLDQERRILNLRTLPTVTLLCQKEQDKPHPENNDPYFLELPLSLAHSSSAVAGLEPHLLGTSRCTEQTPQLTRNFLLQFPHFVTGFDCH